MLLDERRAAADSIPSIQSDGEEDGVTSSLPCLTNRHHNSEQLTYLWPAPPGTTTHLHHLPTPLLNPPPPTPPPHVFHHPHPLHCTLTSQVLTSIFCLNKSCLGGWETALRKDQTNTAQWHARTDRREKKHNKTQDRLPVVRSSHTQPGATADLSFSTQRGRIKGLFPHMLKFWGGYLWFAMLSEQFVFAFCCIIFKTWN